MSTRTIAPVLLLAAAICSLAAVFVVHRIEAAGGPLSEPYATQFFSPGRGDAKGAATIRFTTRQAEQITINIRSCRGRLVRRLVHDEPVHGSASFRWDGRDDRGRRVADGCYRIAITRGGDARVYQPARPTWVDTAAPVAVVDRSAVHDGYWRGLIFTEPGVTLQYETSDGTRLRDAALDARLFRARANHSSGEPKFVTWPPQTNAYRFSVRIVEHPSLRMIAVDNAGNETPLPTDLLDRAERVP